MKATFIGAPVLFFLASAVVSMWVAYDPILGWPAVFTLVGSTALFFAIVSTNISPRRVSESLVIIATLVALYFAGQYRHFGYSEEDMGYPAHLGLFTSSFMPDLVFYTPHDSAVATFLEGVIVLALTLAWQEGGRIRLGWGIATLIILYGILISGARGVWFGLAMAFIIWGLLIWPNRLAKLAVIAPIIVVGLCGFCIAIVTPSTFFGNSFLAELLAAAGDRLVLYRNSFYLLADYPFTGIGPGETFAMVYSRYQLLISVPYLTYARNMFLAVGLGYGLLGLIAFVWMLSRFYHFVFVVEGKGLHKSYFPTFRAAWLGVTATVIHGLTDATQFSDNRWTMPMLFALLGLTIAMGGPALIDEPKTGKNREEFVAQADRWKPKTLAVFGLVIILAVFWQSLLSAWYANLGAVYQTRADLSMKIEANERRVMQTTAINYFQRALRINPAQPSANRRLGMIALDYGRFDMAVTYLEQAYRQEPRNQATLKALGFAYLWSGKLSLAKERLRQVDDQGELIEELSDWSRWWDTQDRTDLSNYATEMIELLNELAMKL